MRATLHDHAPNTY